MTQAPVKPPARVKGLYRHQGAAPPLMPVKFRPTDGLEMGRAQIVQAEAAKIAPHVDMHLTLLLTPVNMDRILKLIPEERD